MAIPSMIESFFVAFAGLVDALMVSSLGSDAVASVGLTTQPKFIALAIFIAINVSLSALVARRFGERDRERANSIFATAFAIIIVLTFAVSSLFVYFASDIIRMCGSTAETHDCAVTYIRIIVGGMIFNCVQMGINAAQRGAGNTKITMRTNVTSNIINIIFNYLLIGGHFGFPALGIRGAAIATVLGTVVASVMSVISILGKDNFISIPFILAKKIKPCVDALKSIFKVGYSVFFEQILLRIGFLATALMAADMGNDAMAAHQVGMNLMGLSFAFGDGLQVAAVALIGRSLGENDPELAKLYGRKCQFVGGVISVVMAALYFVCAGGLMTLFFPEKPHIVTIGVGIIYVLIFAVLFQIRQVVYMGCLRGAGDTFFTALVSAISVTVIRTAVSYIACYSLGFGINGIWFGIAADQMSRCIAVMIRFKMGKWAKIKI
ncbi:MAG: MATE family efflux transporter [Clostridia bacterium]|nr:MATE family efflux transporter [Clostridia bacterium]